MNIANLKGAYEFSREHGGSSGPLEIRITPSAMRELTEELLNDPTATVEVSLAEPGASLSGAAVVTYKDARVLVDDSLSDDMITIREI